MSLLYLITGPRGSGKTTWCLDLVRHAAEKNLPLKGFLSPAFFEDRKKVGIDLLDIETGHRRPLARRHTHPSSGLLMGEWCFDPASLDWGNQILHSLDSNDIIIIDELGPLEFERGTGFIEALRLLDEKCYQKAFVVVRPELLEVAKSRWDGAEVVDIACIKPTLRFLERKPA